jgi:hypothetical protein
MPLLNAEMVGDFFGVTRECVYGWVKRKRLKPELGPPYVFTDTTVRAFQRNVWPNMKATGGAKKEDRRRGHKRRG